MYDLEWKYGQNFYLVVNNDLAKSLLDPFIKKSVSESIKTKEKGWISLGSEVEVEEEQVKNTRDLVS
jgi:hypothetical protein